MQLSRVTTLLLASSLFLSAQSEIGSASLSGTVSDPSGAIVSGAKVTVSNVATGLIRSMNTTEAGLFTFVRLPVGTYNLEVAQNGFAPLKIENLPLTVGGQTSLDLKLQVTSATSSVNVSSEIPLVETTRANVATAVNEKAVRDLPINGRNFLDFTVLTPGVVRDPRGGDLSFGGQRGTANSLLIDGGDSNNLFFGQASGRAGTRNPYTFSQDAVQEFQVNTNGYAPEIGRAGGGVINVVTKSGTNALHGTAFWFFRDKAMNANTFINNSVGRPRQPYHFNQFGGNLGGPIKKDKLFFFYNYDGQRNTLPNAVFFPPNVTIPSDAVSQQTAQELTRFQTPYTTGLVNNIHTVKIDYNISPSQLLNVRYNLHRFTGRNFENAGNQSAAERTGNSKNVTDNLAANYTKIFGATTVWDSRFIFLRDDAPGEANSTNPEAQIRQGGNLMIAIGRNSFSPRYTNSKKYQIINSVSLTRGKHSYKMGGDLNFERIANFFPGNFSGAFIFDSLIDFANRRPSSFTQGFAGAGTNGATTYPNANEVAFFAQDQWRVSDRLTLTYGGRYDLFTYAQNPIRNPDPGLAAMRLDTSRFNRDTNNLAGRFGFAYKLDKEGKQVLRGGYGMFYGRTASILLGTTHSQNGIQVQTYSLNGGIPAQAALIPRYPAILSAPPALLRTPDIYVAAPDYVQPLTHQMNLSYEMQLSRDVAITFGYLGVRGVHLSRARDINHFPLEFTTATFTNGNPSVQVGRRPNTRPNPNFGRITLNDSGGDSIYHAGFIQVSKRYARNFQFLASYTWSKVIDTLPDQTSVVPNNAGDDAKVAFDTLQPNADRALGDAHIPFRFVLSGVWDLNYFTNAKPLVKHVLGGWQVSAISTSQSGRYFTARSNVDLNNDGNRFSDRSPGFGRNTIEGPGLFSVDMRVSKEIPLVGERMKLRIIGEAFNTFNHTNFNALQLVPFNYNATTRVFTPTTNFLAPTNTSDPRILQIAARITF
ncbi:MAG: TonB-dependent receptor [Bryobacteraceae bacterium]|nr:TonB-dependent receptor [Bryobacteraceae bacterium]